MAVSASVSESVLSVVVFVYLSSSLVLFSSTDVEMRRCGDCDVIDSMSEAVVSSVSSVSCWSCVSCVSCESCIFCVS